MTTVYVAAEKLLTWTPDGMISVDENLVGTFVNHCKNNRFVVYFAPARFGLLLDGREEAKEAWHYIERALKAADYRPDEVIIFDDEVVADDFVRDMKKEDIAPYQAILFSNAPQDDILSASTGIRKVTEIPSNISNMWQKISFRRMIRTFVAAAIHT